MLKLIFGNILACRSTYTLSYDVSINELVTFNLRNFSFGRGVPPASLYFELLFFFSFWCKYFVSFQYTSIIFYHDDEQKELAEKSYKKQQILRNDRGMITQVLPAVKFYDAEE